MLSYLVFLTTHYNLCRSKDHIHQAIIVQNPSDLYIAMMCADNTDNVVGFSGALGSSSGGASSGGSRKWP